MFEIPSNINIEVNLTSVKISFDKSDETNITQIDAYWINGENTYDNETIGNVFNYDSLSLGTTYKFKLKSISNTGEVLETGELSFTTPSFIVPTAPTNIIVTIDEIIKNKVYITFEKGQGVRTEIDCYWINGINTWDEYTTDTGFIFENLEFGTEYKFKLRTISNDGITSSESDEIVFKIEDNKIAIPPTPPTEINVKVNIFVEDNNPKNTVEITFLKGEGIKTEIDCYWINTEGTWDQYTTDIGFILENLPFSAQYKFKLRTIGYDGINVSESEEISFTIDSVELPTIPTNITILPISEFKVNDVILAYTQGNKGIGGKTEILKSWGDGANTWYGIDENEIIFNELEFDKGYYIKLRTVTSLGLIAETNTINFIVPKAIHPTIPRDIKFTIDTLLLNKVVITFIKGAGLRTEIDINSEGKWSEYTTDNGFILQELDFGQNYTFQLRSLGNTGEVALSSVFTFNIPTIEPVGKPSNIEISRNKKHVIIYFKKAKNARLTQICKFWESDEYEDFTDATEFDLKELEPGETYSFKLRSVGVAFRDKYNNQKPNYAESKEFTFTLPPYVPALIPSDIKMEVESYNCYVTFTPIEGLEVGIKKLWWHDNLNDEIEKEVESYKWKYDNPDYEDEEEKDRDEEEGYEEEDEEEEDNEEEYDEEEYLYDESTTDKGFALQRLLAGEHKFILTVNNAYEERAESEEMSFNIEKGYVFVLTKPTLPTNFSYVPEGNACAIKFKKGNGVTTQICKIWQDGNDVWSDHTTDNGFYIEELEPSSIYHYKVRSVNTLKETVETEVMTFNTVEGEEEEWVTDTPTVPTNISFVPEGDCCTIKFQKGVGSRTEIDRLWVDEEGSWKEYTLKNGFFYDNLTVGTLYKFRLRSKNSLGEIAETEELSFHTLGRDGEEWVTDTPTVPTNITFIIEGKCFTVKFTKGVGCRTEIDRHWLEPDGTWGEYTHYDGFYYDELKIGTFYKFKIRSINSLGDVAETEELKVRTLKDGGGDGYYVEVAGDVPNGYYSNYEEKWFYTPSKNNLPVGVTGEITEKFETYNAIYRGNPNVKAVYLTFDEGYEMGNTEKILDTLREYNIKAAFLITKKYLNENPDLVKRMVREGHSVANHSSTHPPMANVNRYEGFEGVKRELTDLEDAFRNLTGAKMLKFFRPPMGKYSEEVLLHVKNLGYKNLFWSFSYSDYDIDNQKDPAWTLDYAKSSAFNGCIYLFHAVSTTNAEILGDLILYLLEQDYAIKDLRTIEYDIQI